MQPSFTPTVQLQALTVVTLAKMCLQNEEMAKKVVPAFGRLLSTTSDAALKNNIMYSYRSSMLPPEFGLKSP